MFTLWSKKYFPVLVLLLPCPAVTLQTLNHVGPMKLQFIFKKGLHNSQCNLCYRSACLLSAIISDSHPYSERVSLRQHWYLIIFLTIITREVKVETVRRPSTHGRRWQNTVNVEMWKSRKGRKYVRRECIRNMAERKRKLNFFQVMNTASGCSYTFRTFQPEQTINL